MTPKNWGTWKRNVTENRKTRSRYPGFAAEDLTISVAHVDAGMMKDYLKNITAIIEIFKVNGIAKNIEKLVER